MDVMYRIAWFSYIQYDIYASFTSVAILHTVYSGPSHQLRKPISSISKNMACMVFGNIWSMQVLLLCLNWMTAWGLTAVQ